MVRKKKAEEVRDVPEETDFGKIWQMAFPLVDPGQNRICASAATEGPQRRTEDMVRMQREFQVKGGRWAVETPQRWRQPKGEDRIELKKEAKLLSVYLARWIGLEY